LPILSTYLIRVRMQPKVSLAQPPFHILSFRPRLYRRRNLLLAWSSSELSLLFRPIRSSGIPRRQVPAVGDTSGNENPSAPIDIKRRAIPYRIGCVGHERSRHTSPHVFGPPKSQTKKSPAQHNKMWKSNGCRQIAEFSAFYKLASPQHRRHCTIQLSGNRKSTI
jgi:hypothetical protein